MINNITLSDLRPAGPLKEALYQSSAESVAHPRVSPVFLALAFLLALPLLQLTVG